MKMTVITIIVGALVIINKNLLEKNKNKTGDRESKKELKLFRLQHCHDQQEYWDMYRRGEETCCYLDSSEKPTVSTDMKSSQGIIIIMTAIHWWTHSRGQQNEMKKKQAIAWIDYKKAYSPTKLTISKCTRYPVKLYHEKLESRNSSRRKKT